MTQDDASIVLPETLESPSSSSSSAASDLATLRRNVSLSRLNAKAPEFIPRSSSSSDLTTQPRIVITSPNQPGGLIHVYAAPPPAAAQIAAVPIPVQYVPVQYNNNNNSNNHNHNHNNSGSQKQQHQRHYNINGGLGSGGFVDYQQLEKCAAAALPVDSDRSRNGFAGGVEDNSQKVINQVEFYFSDLNLATTDHLMRFINKDPEGYVPISVVASFKKIKALGFSNSQLASILRSSMKLMVSEDGKKVRRQQPLTESDMEELHARIVVAENLPEDHCHQNLMKIFSGVGSVKMIRTCQPQPSNVGTSSATRGAKAEGLLHNKLHAFVEYESIEVAEKAVVELNDEGNWRNGLRVRLLHKRATQTKPTHVRGKKGGQDGEAHRKEDGASTSEQHEPNEKHLEDSSRDAQSHEHAGEEQVNEKEGGQNKKKSSRGRGKGRGRPQYHHQNNNNHRGSHVGTPPSNNPVIGEQPVPILAKQPPGPRMPDGTKGFSMGRGKPLADSTS